MWPKSFIQGCQVKARDATIFRTLTQTWERVPPCTPFNSSNFLLCIWGGRNRIVLFSINQMNFQVTWPPSHGCPESGDVERHLEGMHMLIINEVVNLPLIKVHHHSNGISLCPTWDKIHCTSDHLSARCWIKWANRNWTILCIPSLTWPLDHRTVW